MNNIPDLTWYDSFKKLNQYHQHLYLWLLNRYIPPYNNSDGIFKNARPVHLSVSQLQEFTKMGRDKIEESIAYLFKNGYLKVFKGTYNKNKYIPLPIWQWSQDHKPSELKPVAIEWQKGEKKYGIYQKQNQDREFNVEKEPKEMNRIAHIEEKATPILKLYKGVA